MKLCRYTNQPLGYSMHDRPREVEKRKDRRKITKKKRMRDLLPPTSAKGKKKMTGMPYKVILHIATSAVPAHININVKRQKELLTLHNKVIKVSSTG